MSEPVAFDRNTGRRFVRVVKDFLTSEVRWRARALFGLLFAFALAVNGLNVINSYVGRDFMTAIAHRDHPEFIRQAVFYVGVFAASTAVAVLYRFTEERLGLFWREWLTRRIIRRYLADRTYLRLKTSGTVDNPDQRIADDVRTFTTTTLSFTLMFLNGVLAVLSFSGVLWTISPLLFGVAIGYAAIGTLAAIYLGRPLVGLAIRHRRPDWAARLMKPATQISKLLNLALLAVVLAFQFEMLLGIRARGFAGMCVLVGAGVASGWLLGGPRSDTRTAMAMATAVRNVGVSLVIATKTFPGTPAVTAATIFAIFQTVLMALVAHVWGRLASASAGTASPPATIPQDVAPYIERSTSPEGIRKQHHE